MNNHKLWNLFLVVACAYEAFGLFLSVVLPVADVLSFAQYMVIWALQYLFALGVFVHALNHGFRFILLLSVGLILLPFVAIWAYALATSFGRREIRDD